MKFKKSTFWVIAALYFLYIGSDLQAQELKTPTPGKSLVYFVRVSGTGALMINFKYFHGDHYIGKFSGVNYFLYECDPGPQMFWVSAENRDFLEANLLPDKVYVVEVRPTLGAFKAAVKLIPILNTDVKDVQRITKILTKKVPIQLDPNDFSDEKEDLKFFISNGLKKYNADKAAGKSIAQLLPENFHN